MAVLNIPPHTDTYEVKCGQKTLTFTNLQKIFWPQRHKTKRDLLTYYAAIAEVLLPHLKDRGFPLKRYPDGIEGKLILLKELPGYRPRWLETCSVLRAPGMVVEFALIQDLPSLLWIVNLGCIDFSPWPVRCDDLERPDYLHFNLDPIFPAEFPQVQEAALLINDFFKRKDVNSYAKTTGLRGIHIYVPIRRKPYQREVWRVAKRIANTVAKEHPALLTAEHIIRKRLPGRVSIGYYQNAGGRTFVSPYSLRLSKEATVSTPVSWQELETGVTASEFDIDSVPSRVGRIGDLFRPLLRPGTRHALEALL